MSLPIKFVFFGSSQISKYVLEELAIRGLVPVLDISSARDPLPMEKISAAEADVFVVASFGKILPKELIDLPKFRTLNMHPSLLPKLRGPAPIQGAIIGEDKTGVSIMCLDEQMDHGPLLAQKEVPLAPWPDRYSVVEEKLGRAGGALLAEILPQWLAGKLKEVEQNHAAATYTRLISKDMSDITHDPPELAYRKILAYEVWPRARLGDLIVTKAHLEDGKLILDKVLPPGKKEMVYTDYLRGHHKITGSN